MSPAATANPPIIAQATEAESPANNDDSQFIRFYLIWVGCLAALMLGGGAFLFWWSRH
jgi:hypothetical protein